MFWIAVTAKINRTLGTAYSIEDVKQMPSDEFSKILIWLEYGR